MQNNFEFIIGEDKAGQRIDKVLSSHPLVGSRSQAASLIGKNLVLLKNKPVKPSHITTLGEKFLISIPTVDNSSPLEPFDIHLDVLYEDGDLLVVNKPSGLVVHPAHGHINKTLVNALIHHTKNLSMGFGENRPGIVHRLDKETSGLLVVAKNNFTHEHLAQQFKLRKIHRVYLAIVFGELKEASGQIATLIGRHPNNRKKFSGKVAAGKAAITNFKKISYAKGFSLVELKLETGRTHQIRVHLSEKGHPIAGDTLYGADKRIASVKNSELKEYLTDMKRISLHAKELGFIHPKTQKNMLFTSEIPMDLVPLFNITGLIDQE